jgi:hypothetical protein
MPWDLDDLEDDDEFAAVEAPMQQHLKQVTEGKDEVEDDDETPARPGAGIFAVRRQEKTPIIFLNIEGVLHPEGSDNWFGETQMLSLKRVVEQTQAQIVLSSEWRLDNFELRKVCSALSDYDIHVCIGGTQDLSPELPDATTLERTTNEIGMWLEENEDFMDEDHWVALDAHALDTETEDGATHTVQTDGAVGLTEAKADEAIKILTAPA